MKKLAFGALIALTVIIAAATLIEAKQGTAFVGTHIYGSLWFVIVWAVLAIAGTAWMIHTKLYRRLAAFTLHVAFLVMLAGAAITFFTATKGHVHIRTDRPASDFTNTATGMRQPLPFTLVLDSFLVRCYPGTDAPLDYVSHLRLSYPDGGNATAVVSMNNILGASGYRFYQSSFDPDHQGTILSVNHDPVGITVTYTGYILMALGMLWTLISPAAGFRRLLRHPLLKKGALVVAALLCVHTAGAQTPLTLPESVAAAFGRLQLMNNNRVTPVNTLARDFALKVTGKKTFGDLNSEQLFCAWIFSPQDMQHMPMVRIKSKQLQQILGTEEYAPFTAFFTPELEYKLAALWTEHHRGERTPIIKAITETDEKVQLINMLQYGTMLKLFPVAGSHGAVRWYSPVDELPEDTPAEVEELIKNSFVHFYKALQEHDFPGILELIEQIETYQQSVPDAVLSPAKVRAELLYNRIDVSTILYRFNLTVGLAAFLYFFLCLIKGRAAGRWGTGLFTAALLCSFLFHTFGMGLRTYISGRFPLTNGYETMIFIAWCIMLTALVFRRKFALLTAFGLLLSGFALLVSGIGQMNPQITPLMPVLISPWLSLHVSLIMMSYALFAFIALNGITAVVLKLARAQSSNQVEKLSLLSRLFLYPAVFFLGAGIFIGAVWANVSWGSYWSWDPKEVWALVTFFIYALAFHLQSLKPFNRPLFFHVYMILAFASVLMTYFGVNYVLGGMHSYGG